MSQTISMSFPVAPKTFPTFRTSFLRLLGTWWVWILPWNIEKFHIAKPESPIGCSGSTETHGGMSSSSVHRKLLLLHFLYRKQTLASLTFSVNSARTFVSRLQPARSTLHIIDFGSIIGENPQLSFLSWPWPLDMWWRKCFKNPRESVLRVTGSSEQSNSV